MNAGFVHDFPRPGAFSNGNNIHQGNIDGSTNNIHPPHSTYAYSTSINPSISNVAYQNNNNAINRNHSVSQNNNYAVNRNHQNNFNQYSNANTEKNGIILGENHAEIIPYFSARIQQPNDKPNFITNRVANRLLSAPSIDHFPIVQRNNLPSNRPMNLQTLRPMLQAPIIRPLINPAPMPYSSSSAQIRPQMISSTQIRPQIISTAQIRPQMVSTAASNMEMNRFSNSSFGSSQPQQSVSAIAGSRMRSGSIQSESSVMLATEDLEEYRNQVKKSNDPKVALDFAKMLVRVAEEIRMNPKGLDAKRVRKNRDIIHAEAVRWIKKAAAGSILGKPGFDQAIFMLADCYGNGTLGLEIDHDKAFGLYSQSTKQNHPASIYRLAVCYEVGAGTRKDAARAVQLYLKAAQLTDTASMYKIGTILLKGGLGLPKNPREGVNWLKRAASEIDHTTPFALHELALLHQSCDPEIATFMVQVTML